jgi:glycosyltransferase involved in cell wall biosynthesis
MPLKIVHLEEFFHPDAGYQVNMLSRLQVADGHQVTVVAAELEKMPSTLTTFFGKEDIADRDAEFTKSTGVEIVRVPILGYYSGRAIFYPSVFKRVAAAKPDVALVHAMETLTGIVFVWLSKFLAYPLALDSHMLDMATRNRFSKWFTAFFRRFVTPKILREKIPTIRVVDTDYLQKFLAIPLATTELSSFGTDTAHFSPNAAARLSVRDRLGLSRDSFLVIYAGKLDDAKGAVFMASAIEARIETQSGRPIEFLIIGNSDGAYGASVEAALAKSANKIVRLPTQRFFDLAEFYQASDIALYPRQCSLSFFEAQSCGLPVLFEENEINTKRSGFDNARTFPPGDAAALRRNIQSFADLPETRLSEMRSNARNHVLSAYNFLPVARRLTALLQSTAAAWQRQRH